VTWVAAEQRHGKMPFCMDLAPFQEKTCLKLETEETTMSRDTEEVKNVEEGNILSETSENRIFVLQCAHCKTLLGDTGSLVSAQVEQSAIVLSST
jgi:hypothetical protein